MENDPQSFAELERTGWERVAGQYESVWAPLTQKFIEPLLQSVGVKQAMNVLDIACGPGYAAHAASRKGAIATGIDFSREMIAIAENNYPQVHFIEGNAQSLPFRNESFDGVLMNFGLLHIPDPDLALKEACRVLRPQGRLGFTVWAPPELSEGSRIMRNAFEKFGNMDVDLPEGPPYFRFSEEQECRKSLTAAGFRESSVKFETLTVQWHVPTDTFLFNAELQAGVRTAALLARQKPAQLEAIRQAVKIAMENYKADSGYIVPFAAHIITATRAAS
jgi:ubiquinone/menaquinone biosynthesis C-methylase UbiE